MMGIGGGMVFGSLLTLSLLLGFAYIVWVLSAKESGSLKMTGQVISIVIAVVAIIIFLYTSIYRGTMGMKGCGKDSHMMGKDMMSSGSGMCKCCMENMMKSKDMKKMMK